MGTGQKASATERLPFDPLDLRLDLRLDQPLEVRLDLRLDLRLVLRAGATTKG